VKFGLQHPNYSFDYWAGDTLRLYRNNARLGHSGSRAEGKPAGISCTHPDVIDHVMVGNTHSRGTLSMARSQDPNSAGSQFFIVLKDSRFLDGKYTVFGKVTSGMDIVDTIATIRTDHTDAPVDIEQAKMIKVAIGN